MGRILNTGNVSNRAKKVLILQDSFAYYSTTFLACDIEEIDVIYPREFTGSIRTFIEKENPDLVVMMMGECNIVPIQDDRFFLLR